jgi:hypothetical protein
VKKQAVVEGALEVLKDALHGREIGLMRVVHVEAHMLDRVGNVGPGEGEVLKSPSQVAVGSRVKDGGPDVGGDLGASRSSYWINYSSSHFCDRIEIFH